MTNLNAGPFTKLNAVPFVLAVVMSGIWFISMYQHASKAADEVRLNKAQARLDDDYSNAQVMLCKAQAKLDDNDSNAQVMLCKPQVKLDDDSNSFGE